MDKVYDVVIIGSGPAGLTAAVYGARAGITQVVLERNAMSGGQMVYTNEIENYPGIISIDGFSLGMTMRQQAEKLGVEFVNANVTALERSEKGWLIHSSNGDFIAKNIIYATGATHKKLGVEGEAEFVGRGVSYCATCDGNFYRNKTVMVVGGGNTALQDALYLGKLAKKVYLVHRRDSFRGLPATLKAIKELDNIEILTNRTVKKLQGEGKIQSVVLQEGSEEREVLAVDGIFVAVGIVPNNDILPGMVKLDGAGFVITDEDCLASDNLYVAGDGRSKKFRQIITAAADGAIAMEALLEKY